MKSDCYPPPKNLMWRVVRMDNTTALAALITRYPGELNGRFPCLRDQTLLHQAAAYGAHHSVAWLIDRGADLEARDLDGRTPLMEAARGGQAKTVRLLLDQGADGTSVDYLGRNALLLGAGNHRVLEKFFRKNERPGGARFADSAGDTPLHRAAAAGSAPALGLLIKAGADVNKTNLAGESPLHVALLNRRLNATQVLLESGADPNAELGDGRRPLHLAVSGNGEDAARLLLERSVFLNPRTAGGQTPLGLAMTEGRSSLVALLKEKGATQ